MSHLLTHLKLSLCLWLLSIIPTHAAGDLLLLHQVRGPECCDAGSLDFLHMQLDTLDRYHFPGVFLWRYDALQQPDWLDAWRHADRDNQFTAGLWLEVTPSLASASGVPYRGDLETWYHAEQAFLVGYTPNERRQILDTLLTTYQQAFGHTPIIAGAWTIDSDSLDYLHQQGLQAYMNVREQYGTDSYTNYGGPVHYPYFASRHWYLNPTPNNDGMLVLKHTISDPLGNYGDTTSTFTSQPNDYSQAGRTTQDYFAHLLRQAMNQGDQRGWAVIGLENSMSEQWQLAYQDQLALVADFAANSDWLQVVDIQQVLDRFRQPDEMMHFYHGQQSDNPQQRAIWIETPRYRLRYRQQNNHLFLDDVRAYDSNFTDYYNTHQAVNASYQIVPPIIDSSAYLSPYHLQIPTLESFTVIRDDTVTRGWQLPDIAPGQTVTLSKQDNQITLRYPLADNSQAQLIFSPDFWTSNVALTPITDTYPWGWQAKDYPSQQLFQSSPSGTLITYQTHSQLLPAARQHYPALLLPEIRTATPSGQTSRIRVHNRYAGAGRNPVRLFFFALDEHGFPVNPQDWQLITQPAIEYTTFSGTKEYLYLDLHSDKAQKVQVKLLIHNQPIFDQTVIFAADCRAADHPCGWNLVQWWRYFCLKVSDWWRSRHL